MTLGFDRAGLTWTDGRLYPPLPHVYREVEDMVVAFETRAEGVAAFLPRGVVPCGDPVPCQAKFRWAPFSVHGPYHEAYISATVRHAGEDYRFLLAAYVDNDSAFAAGRELWGAPKKMARLTRSWGGTGGLQTESKLAAVERPAHQMLMQLGMTIDAALPEPEAPGLPTLLLKLVPDADGVTPALAQLIRIDGHARFCRAADDTPMLFTGRPSLSFPAMSASDPLFRLKPERLTGASFARVDFEHGPGRVVHDYLA
ncbi:acetoacetate decarboxylase family protein [Rhodosalinus sp.]|uniref:acetoacetate decarboxylase family protein n=1 Tax=Rhodosalinus sp. TaxID=2047741 RepID=UPI00397D6C77